MIDGPDESVDGGKPRFSALISIYYCRASLPRRKGIKIHRSGGQREERALRERAGCPGAAHSYACPKIYARGRPALSYHPRALFHVRARTRDTLPAERTITPRKQNRKIFVRLAPGPRPPAGAAGVADSLIDVQEFRGAINLTLYLAHFPASGIIKVMKISAARRPPLVLARN